MTTDTVPPATKQLRRELVATLDVVAFDPGPTFEEIAAVDLEE